MNAPLTVADAVSGHRRRKDEWPEARVERMLELLLAQRWSYQQIADDLGVTRNAVSGMIIRMRARQRARLGLRPSPPPTARPNMRKAARAEADRAMRNHRERQPARTAEPNPASFIDLIMEDGRKRCLFPLKESEGGMHMTCCGGRVAEPGADGAPGSYCGYHARLAGAGAAT